jgi:tRNA threonylcarbamoyladenosine biosynthesis protein TsaB
MYILAFDTSQKKDSCTIINMNGDILISLSTFSADKSENILKLIELAIETVGIKKDEIDLIGVCKGPGSFTGIRIGIATAIGLSKSLNIPAYGVDRFKISKFVSNKDCYIKKGDSVFVLDGNRLVEGTKKDDWLDISDLDLTNSEIIAKIVLRDKNNIIKHNMDLSAVY